MDKEMTVTLAELIAAGGPELELLALFGQITERRKAEARVRAKAQRERNREILEAGRKALGLEVKKA